MFDIVKDRSDDSYGDLLDALPLCGRALCRRAILGEFAGMQHFSACVAEQCGELYKDRYIGAPVKRPLGEAMSKVVLNGESFISHNLGEAAIKKFSAWAYTDAMALDDDAVHCEDPICKKQEPPEW